MTKRYRGRNHRIAAPRMPKFLASDLPDPVKTGVAETVRELEALWAEDPEGVIPPDMLLRVNELLGCSTIETIDLLRILTMAPPHLQCHTRENLGALLRGKQLVLGRPLTATDFPSGHRMEMFASAWWGGIAAWNAGAAGRAQRPKSFWASRANQIDAITRFAVAHPDMPITHANLHAAGLHRLATILTSAELVVLVAEAGLDRQLRHRPDQAERWTQEAVLAAYVSLCRMWGVTLSSSALLAMAGEASSLRSYARQAFGSFGAMVDAAVRAHTDLQPLTHYVAADGTRLDSQAEVIVWNALRAALPNVGLVPHVVLPGETQRSADVVVGGVVYVETLMMAVAEMAKPANAKLTAYAEKWSRKSAIYGRLGIRPILFEPADVYDAVRTAARVAEIAALLSITPIPAAPSPGKTTRAKGFWDHDNLCAAVAEVVEVAHTGETFPTNAQLTEHGYGHAVNLLKRRGVRHRIATALGLSDPHARNVWTREHVVTALVSWCRTHGRYPTTSDVQPHGVASAAKRLWAGQQAALRTAVTVRLGVELPTNRAPKGCHDTLDDVARLLEPLARLLARMPTCAEYRAAGLNSAWSAASRKWGIAAVARVLGLEHSRARGKTQGRTG